MRKIGLWIGILGLLLWPKSALAADYIINSFESDITLEQDSSLVIEEKIDTNFLVSKHGIIRVIPDTYSAKGKTIKSQLTIIGITDGKGKPIPFSQSRLNQSLKLQIGDANKTITGEQIYVIKYRATKVVLDYGDGPEVYWNVTGMEWGGEMRKVSAKLESPFGEIVKTECFGCITDKGDNWVEFKGQKGLTFVAQISKNNKLISPTAWQKTAEAAGDNWGYLAALVPVTAMGLAWYRKGRDKRYLTENVFYKPDDKTTKNVGLLSRPHLPLVYQAIDGLTPAGVGTIVDERVDTKDIVAEIIELARLGVYKIEKIETKGFLGIKDNDYLLTKTGKEIGGLKKYQEKLVEYLFGDKNEIKISELKNHFYLHLNALREEIYKEMDREQITEGNITKTRAIWIGWATLLNILAGVSILTVFASMTGNYGPVLPLILGGIIAYLFAGQMPRKTAWGYSLSRQATGLRYYLDKGKWRQEIAEKKLFLEETLPLAIALGVVSKLAKDMKDLEIEPPSYFEGVAVNSFVNDLNNFSKATATNMVTAPQNYSGSGSWSGGSGFSGGGGGGGFGGGGGGSW